MGNLSASDSPDSFHRVEFGGIRRQKDTDYTVSIRAEQLFQSLRFVPSRIVQNKVDFPLSGLKKITDKVAKGLCVESGSFSGEESPRFEVECPEEAHFVADRGREHAGLLSLGCPHPYQAAVPLEMDFVLAPKLDGRVFHPLVVVFLKASCWIGD